MQGQIEVLRLKLVVFNGILLAMVSYLNIKLCMLIDPSTSPLLAGSDSYRGLITSYPVLLLLRRPLIPIEA